MFLCIGLHAALDMNDLYGAVRPRQNLCPVALGQNRFDCPDHGLWHRNHLASFYRTIVSCLFRKYNRFCKFSLAVISRVFPLPRITTPYNIPATVSARCVSYLDLLLPFISEKLCKLIKKDGFFSVRVLAFFQKAHLCLSFAVIAIRHCKN